MAIAMVKVTFTLDEVTIQRLNEAAAHRQIPKSQAVREAIEQFSFNRNRLSEAERKRRLDAFQAFLATRPKRSRASVNKELADLRESRRGGWLRSTDRA
jgi:predicted transcriptional regulator